MRHLIMPFLAAGALLLSTAPTYADLGDQLAKLLAEDGAVADQFGRSVAIDGTTAIVGAWFDDDNGTHSGSAYLFDTTTGQQLFKLLPNDGEAGDNFGVSVAINGTTAIVGAHRDDDSGSHFGSAYLFDTTTGRQIVKLLPEDGSTEDHFGNSVAISGPPGKQVAIVGALQDDDNGYNSGSAYLFDLSDPANPVQIAKLLPEDGAADDRFGGSVAISGTTAIVGAWFGNDDNGDDSGSAYLFDTTTGQQIAKLLPDDGSAEDVFGVSVAIRDTIAIVAAIFDDDNGTDSGSAYLFDISDPANPVQIFKLLPDDGAQFDWFGRSAAISGTTAIVGSERDDDNGDNSGSAYLFDTNTGQQIAKLLAEDGAVMDLLGESVGIDGTTAIVGARTDDANANAENSGSAYLFDAAAPGKCPWDVNSDGVVDHHDIVEVVHNLGVCDDPDNCPWDVNGDGTVNGHDVAAVARHFGACP